MTRGGFPSFRSAMTTSQVSWALRMSSLPSPGAVQSNPLFADPSTRTDCRKKYLGAATTSVLPAADLNAWVVFAPEMTLPPSITSNGYPPAIATGTVGAATGLGVAAGTTSGVLAGAGGS